jgi:glycosyltransferase involved in cell wall biosynthesis
VSVVDPGVAPDISVVIPCRNEEANAIPIAEAVIAEMERAGASFDLIFIDNASEDRTVPLLRGLCERDPRVRLIVNARNFGQMRSPTHGIFVARGRAVINMCADFQDSPALIGRFVERWRAGVDIVLGVRASETSSPGLSFFRNLAYRLAARFGDYPVIPNATGFGLYDRKVVRAIERLKEPEPFFRGMLVETGYDIELIPYARPPRAAGKSNNDFFALLDFALSGLAGSSKKLVRLPFHVGVVALLIGALMLVATPVAWWFGRNGWGWLFATMVQLQIGAGFVFLGLVGDQIRLISERTRNTPLVTERERVNFPDGY